MHGKLKDLRYLYLACQIEEAFEGLEKGFAKHLPPVLRSQIEVLFGEGPNHRRLRQALAALNSEVAAREQQVQPQDILAAIRDCELLARDFYRRSAPALADPALAQIFLGLAAEEQTHLEAAERALQMAG